MNTNYYYKSYLQKAFPVVGHIFDDWVRLVDNFARNSSVDQVEKMTLIDKG